MSSVVIPSATNRLAPVSYDGRGNTVAETRPGGVAVAASYDGHARLGSYDRSNIGAQTYSYNGLGDRVRVNKPTGTRHFVYDSQGRVVAEYGASTAEVKAEFIWALPPAANDNSPFGGDDGIVGYAPLALVTTNTSSQLTLYWVHGNHLGVPMVTTNALGQVVDPGNDFLRPGFPGQSQVLSDLYYNRARDYDPVLGRYIQADPIGLLGDVNPYLYANGDPVNMIDPLGLTANDWIWSGPFAGIAIASDALAGVNARNAGRAYRFGCFDGGQFLFDVALGYGAGKLIGLGWRLGSRSPFLRKLLADESGAVPIPWPKGGEPKLWRDPSGNPLPRVPQGPGGNGFRPDPSASGPHSRLGTQPGKKSGSPYNEAAEFDGNGNFNTMRHFSDHNRPEQHPNPHQHRATTNPTGGTDQRGKSEPFD